MAEHNEYVEPDDSVSNSIVAMDWTSDNTAPLENASYDDVAEEQTVEPNSPVDSYTIITIDRTASVSNTLENGTYNTVFIGQIVYSVYGRVNRRTGFKILSSTKFPIIWSSSAINNPFSFYTRTDALPMVFHSGLPFSTTDKEIEMDVENPTNNQSANENRKSIGSTDLETLITVDKTDDETATVTTTYNYSVA